MDIEKKYAYIMDELRPRVSEDTYTDVLVELELLEDLLRDIQAGDI